MSTLDTPWKVTHTDSETYNAWPGEQKYYTEKIPLRVSRTYRITGPKGERVEGLHSYALQVDVDLFGGRDEALAHMDDNAPEEVAEMEKLCRLMNSWGGRV